MSEVRGRLKYIQNMFPNVTRVYDSGKKLIVDVLDSDCSTAKPNEPDDCALARAVKRQVKSTGVVVGISSTYIVKGNSAVRFKTGPAIGREITSFDRHKDFAPGVYTLGRVPPANKLGKTQSPRVKNRSGKHIEPRHRTERIRILYDGKKRNVRKKKDGR